jgi:hypothetical protein
MPRSWIFPLAVVLLGLVAALFLWPEKVSPPVQALESLAQVDDSSPLETAPVDPAPAAKQPPPASERVELATTDAEVDVAPSALQPQYEGDDGFTLRVIDAITRQPIPGADVYIKETPEFYRQLRLQQHNTAARTLIKLLPLIGKHYQADSSGIVRLAPLAKDFVAMATKGNLLGSKNWIPITSNTADILMRVNRPFTIHVVRANGVPVEGAPVTVQSEVNGYSSTRRFLRTDDQGSTTFDGLCTLINSSRGVQTFYAKLDVPNRTSELSQQQRVKLTDSIFKTGSVTLTMPPIGGVRISILDPQGNLSTESGVVELNLKESVDGSPTAITLSEAVVNGIAEFPYIGLGTALTAEYHPPNGRNSESISLAGPLQAGEWVETSIRTTDWPVYTGILLSPDGDPISDSNFDLKIEFQYQNGPHESRGQFHTDASGKFSCEASPPLPSATPLSQRAIFSAEWKEFGKCDATLSLPDQPLPGENPIGEVTLQALPIVLSGRIIDEQDLAIAAAKIEVFCNPPSAAGSMNLGRIQTYTAESKPDGTFIIQGRVVENSSCFVIVDADGYESFRQDFSPGLVDVDFRLGKAGVLLGSVLLDQGIPHDQLSLTMKRAQRNASIRLHPSEDPGLFNFRFEGNTDIPYTFLIDSRWDENFFTLEGIILSPNAATRPPKLQPVDLRGRFHQLKVFVQNEEGQRIDAGLSIVEENRTRSTSMNAGAITLLLATPVKSITLGATGYISKTILDPGPEVTVTLERALEVLVQLPPEFLQYRGMNLSLRVISKKTQEPLPSKPFDSFGKSTLFVPGTGEYEISLLILKHRRGGFFSEANFLKLGSHNIERTGQTLTLAVDQAALDKVVDLVDLVEQGD